MKRRKHQENAGRLIRSAPLTRQRPFMPERSSVAARADEKLISIAARSTEANWPTNKRHASQAVGVRHSDLTRRCLILLTTILVSASLAVDTAHSLASLTGRSSNELITNGQQHKPRPEAVSVSNQSIAAEAQKDFVNSTQLLSDEQRIGKATAGSCAQPIKQPDIGVAKISRRDDHQADGGADAEILPTQLVPRTLSTPDLLHLGNGVNQQNTELLVGAASQAGALDPLVASASKKKKKMMKKKKKMEKKHKEWKKGKKHKKKKYESKKKKGGMMKKKKGKKEKKKWGMEKKGHKKKGNFKKKKWGHKKKMKKGHKKGKKGHKMLKDKGHKKKGFKKVYHKEEWGKKKKWHDIKREKKWNTKQKKWKKKWHQEKGKKYKGKHMKKYHKKNKHGKKYKKEKKSKWKKHKGEKFKKGHKKKKEEYAKKKEGGKKKKMKKMKKEMKKKKG